jgi:hypothetical protein
MRALRRFAACYAVPPEQPEMRGYDSSPAQQGIAFVYVARDTQPCLP